jgi:hypothetical protein
MAWVTGKSKRYQILTFEKRYTNSVSVAKDGERDDLLVSYTRMLTLMEVVPGRHVEGQVRRDFFHLPQCTRDSHLCGMCKMQTTLCSIQLTDTEYGNENARVRKLDHCR